MNKIQDKLKQQQDLLHKLDRSLALQAIFGKDIWGDGKIKTTIKAPRMYRGELGKAYCDEVDIITLERFKVKIASDTKVLCDSNLATIKKENPKLYTHLTQNKP